MALSTSINGGITSQINTQNPQTAGQPATGAAPSGSVQPGTTTSLLTSQGGVPLYSTALPTVKLSPAPTTQRAVTSGIGTTTPKHQVDSALFVLPALLVVVAIVFFWVTNRSVKSTTE